MIRAATTAACKVVSSSTLTGPFEFERECKRLLNLHAHSNSNGPIEVEDETTWRAAIVADLIIRVSGKLRGKFEEQAICGVTSDQ